MVKRKENPLRMLLDCAAETLPSGTKAVNDSFHMRVEQPRRWERWLRGKLEEYFPTDIEQPVDTNLVLARIYYGIEYVNKKRAGEVASPRLVRSVRAAWGIEGGAFDPELKTLFVFTSMAKEEMKMATKKTEKKTVTKKAPAKKAPTKKKVVTKKASEKKTPPKKTPPKKNAAAPKAPKAIKKDDRTPKPGTALTGKYKGKVYKCTVTAAGWEVDGKTYKSATAAAKACDKTMGAVNGWRFWGVK